MMQGFQELVSRGTIGLYKIMVRPEVWCVRFFLPDRIFTFSLAAKFTMSAKIRKIGGTEVFGIGYGAMGIGFNRTADSDEERFKAGTRCTGTSKRVG